MSEYEVVKINPALVFADPEFNCRGVISPLDVKALAEDIKEHGLISPVVVQPFSGKPGKDYRIIAGHRRFMACMLLEWPEVPVIIKEGLDETEAKILNLTENLHRQNLNIWQEAQAIAHLGDNRSDEWLSKKLGQSKGWIQPRKMLLKLPIEIQEEAKAGLINQTIIRDCYSLRDDIPAMYELVKHHKDAKARGEKVTIRTSKKDPKTKRKRQPWEIMKLMELIAATFGFGLTTRALAWASGEIADYEILDTISDTAVKMNIPFERPEVVVQLAETLTQSVREVSE